MTASANYAGTGGVPMQLRYVVAALCFAVIACSNDGSGPPPPPPPSKKDPAAVEGAGGKAPTPPPRGATNPGAGV